MGYGVTANIINKSIKLGTIEYDKDHQCPKEKKYHQSFVNSLIELTKDKYTTNKGLKQYHTSIDRNFCQLGTL